MPDMRVFDKIQKYIAKIDNNSDQVITQKELQKAQKEIPSIWFEKISDIVQDSDTSTDKIYMKLGVDHAEEMDESHTLDPECDGGIHRFKCDDEEQNYANALRSAKFFIERNVEKWFKFDINRDGITSSIEDARFGEFNENPTMIDGDLNEAEYAAKNGLEVSNDKLFDYKSWVKDWKENVLYTVAYDYGVELKEEDIKALDDYAKLQVNRMLLKNEQYETAPLYARCGNDAYTRLVTDEQAVSCCGGDITPPPASPNKNSCLPVFSAMNSRDSVNTSDEVRTRLAWAAFKTPPEKYLNRSKDAMTVWQDMPDGMYKMYHNQWSQLKNMSAADYRDLLKPENEQRRLAFEANSSMSVKQIVDYIDIVESTTGKPFDSDGWSINSIQFEEICKKINGTYGDEAILEGKTKADVLPERQDLYNYLQENGLLLEQFVGRVE